MTAREVICTHPDVRGSDSAALLACIEACLDCASACNACADACLAEENVSELKQCIRLDLDCADICATTARLATRRTGSNEELLRGMLELCAAACAACAEECDIHAEHMEHCRLCAEACRDCEKACRQAIDDVGTGAGPLKDKGLDGASERPRAH